MTRRICSAIYWLAVMSVLEMMLAADPIGAVWANDSIQVRFDCGPAIMCRDVTTCDFSGTNPDEKIVEATILITTRIVKGDARDLKELLFEVSSPGQRLRVRDFSPTTELTSDIAEPIRIVTTVDRQKSLGASLGSTIVAPGPIDAKVTPSVNLGTAKHTGVREEQQKLPPKSPVIVSGTSNYGHGVFFKFRPSSQTTLEGVHELTCRFVVPKAWRGDWLLLACRATGDRTKYLMTTHGRCGEARYVVGLYLEGEPDAKVAAEQLAAAQMPAGTLRDNSIDQVGQPASKPELRAASEFLSTFSAAVQ